MKKLMQKSVMIFLALMLIMATGGFSIYHHFCKCEGESQESIFIDAECEHECAVASEPACCQAKPEKSCCSDSAKEQKASNHKPDDCCNSTSSFFKISDNFRVSFEKVSFKFIAAFINLLTGIDFLSEPRAALLTEPDFNDTSPPLYGTDLLHHIHQLKLDQPLV